MRRDPFKLPWRLFTARRDWRYGGWRAALRWVIYGRAADENA